MMTGKIRTAAKLMTAICMMLFFTYTTPAKAQAASEDEALYIGGGYAATGQLKNIGYETKLYDATNGLPTSDAMFLLNASDGRMWIGGYSGVVCYDGSYFERLDTSGGLTSARGLFEDSKGRIWVGTNDNGVVVIDGRDSIHLTYKDGLPSSSIRIFAEDMQGNVFIGTTSGVCYADSELKLHELSGADISEERVLKLDTGPTGRIYGQTSNGVIFAIDECEVTEVYTSEEFDTTKITALMADPNNAGYVYLGIEDATVYYGRFGDKSDRMERLYLTELGSAIHWFSYDCGRVWVSSAGAAGYLDENKDFHLLDNILVNSGIEMTTSDYQGNMWFASSTQGVMKLVTNNFVDISRQAGIAEDVANAVCVHNNEIYIGTDNGLKILDKNGELEENSLTEYIENARIRCITEDNEGNLWIGTFNYEFGLIRYAKNGEICPFTVLNGLPDNQIRSVAAARDGSILVGTDGGLGVVKNDKIVRSVGTDEGILNTVFLCVAENDDGTVMAGSDGDGIYIIGSDKITRLGRDDGLTSEVVMKIKRDEKHGVYWLVTSNSIEYMKDGKITPVTSFPYNNNYDIYFDDNNNAWVLSSNGIYTVNADDMLNDSIKEYRLYTVADGLPYAVTANSCSSADVDGNLYIPGRKGVIRVNINNYFDGKTQIKTALGSLYCDDERIYPGENGTYTIPASQGRIRIIPSVMDYTYSDPLISVYLEGSEADGITVKRSKLSSLEYTSLPYGKYTIHIQVLDNDGTKVLSDDTFNIVKEPRLTELLIVKVLLSILIVLLTGFAVWRFLRSTVIKKQYEEISRAKDEAERANTAKSRFLANMSHEIRTPINTIMGMNEMAMREDAEGVPKKYFMSMMNYAFDIRNASETLLGLINDVLDMSKIESGKMHLIEQEYDTQEMIRSIVSMIRVRSTQKELTFDVVVDEILPKRLYGDPGKIKQIVLNLLTNALKYTSMGGMSLTVSVNGRNNDICDLAFSVKDTGIGVKEEDIEKLFTAYERLDEEKNSGIQGAGLGLDISRRFAELMNGDLTCESVYGEGSEFVFSVSQKIVDEKPIGVFMEHDDNAAKGPYVPQFIAPDANVLVVDDNPMNLNVIKGLLKPTKVFVTTASSGEECLDLIGSTSFDVVLLDHLMPGMDGIETVSKIREKYPELPVYALTANSASGEGFYISKGFNGYLSKPIDSTSLEKAIMRHLPEEIMDKSAAEEAEEELKEIPAEMSWIYETDGISVNDGIRNSGGVSGFLFALQLFLDTIDDNAKVIQNAYDSNDIRLYTIKVHSLKSSARIIGALHLSALAEKLEDAGNHNDTEFINDNNGALMDCYHAFKDKLARLSGEDGSDDSDKDTITEDDLLEAYEMLESAIPQRDYDLVMMIMERFKEYKLPDDVSAKVTELRKLADSVDWGGMEMFMQKLKP